MTLKAWLPAQRIPVLDPDGTMSRPWYLFFQYLANQRLGGPNGRDNAVIVEAVNAANANGTHAKTAFDSVPITNSIVPHGPI